MSSSNGRISRSVIKKLAKSLTPNELDVLKYKMSVSAVRSIAKRPNIDGISDHKFSGILDCLRSIQPYSQRIPRYGLAYLGRPNFVTDEVLKKLNEESDIFRCDAKLNLNQYLAQVETDDNQTYCEKIAASKELRELVQGHAGPSLPSFVTSYIYYDEPQQFSRPHVDNAFTSITAMMCLSQKSSAPDSETSSSFIYWPDSKRFNYRLKPGEVSIFFGASVLHGRTMVSSDEKTKLLLISFRPDVI